MTMAAIQDLTAEAAPEGPRERAPSRMQEAAFGFVYWVLIVGALAPGNWVNAVNMGAPPHLGREVLRVAAAGLLGSVTAPIFCELSRRFPIAKPRRWRNGSIHLVAAALCAFILIVAGHILALWLLDPAHNLSLAGWRDDLAANEVLVFVGIIALSGLAHMRRPRLSPTPSLRPSRAPEVVPLKAIEIKEKGRSHMVSVEEIDWIEAQGNYVALHVGNRTLLLRQTLTRLESRLDPARFVRIHRRDIVALDRISGIESTANGDAVVHLKDNTQLRVSRIYRQALKRGLTPLT
jgi:hypothetical protein